MAEDTKQVPENMDIFVGAARDFMQTVVTPPGDAHEDLDREVREYHPKLAVKFCTETHSFWLCRELNRAPGLYFPIEDIGYFPDKAEVLAMLPRMDVRGKAKTRARDSVKAADAAYEERARRCAEYAMPRPGEYMRRLNNAMDDGIAKSLAREMRQEVKRDQTRTPAPQ